MNPWLEGVRRVLARTPMGALSLSILLRELRFEGLGVVPDPKSLLKAVSDREDQFRVFHLGIGPWSRTRLRIQEAVGGGPEFGPGDDPWILLLRVPGSDLGPVHGVGRRIQAGLVEWGRNLDEGCPASVARWVRAIGEGGGAWSALVSGLPQGR